jgi:hypothetical protein
MKAIAPVFAAIIATTVALPAAHAEKNQWVAAGLNWVLPGAGYAYNGEKPLYVTVPMMLGAVGLTYVENIHEFDDGKRLLDHDKTAFGVLFGAVLVINTALAIDAYQEAGAINARSTVTMTSWRIDLRRGQSSDSGYALTLGRSF